MQFVAAVVALLNQITFLNDELRGQGNPNHDEKGRFCSGNGGSASVDNSEKSDTIEDTEKNREELKQAILN